MSLEAAFPGLKNGGYSVTSPVTGTYNCIAWAAGIDSIWWDPAAGYFWPENAPREYGIEALKAVFVGLGFSECDSSKQENGFEKVALYGHNGEWTHAARMLDSGKWTSKLGPQEDIEHASPEGLSGDAYGVVVYVMKRPLKQTIGKA